jgi:hypothetical protein
MATNKDLEANTDPESQQDVDSEKGPDTGEGAIEYLVEGLTEEDLKGVVGGLAPGLGTKPGTNCNLCSGVVVPHCVSYYCSGFDPSKGHLS